MKIALAFAAGVLTGLAFLHFPAPLSASPADLPRSNRYYNGGVDWPPPPEIDPDAHVRIP